MLKYYDFAMKFRRAVKRADHRGARMINLITSKGNCRVRTSDIVYVEALDHSLTYHLQEMSGNFVDLEIKREKMKSHESLLKPYNFCRIHKSFLINLAQIKIVRANDVLVGDAVIPIGRSYKKDLMTEYLRFVQD